MQAFVCAIMPEEGEEYDYAKHKTKWLQKEMKIYGEIKDTLPKIVTEDKPAKQFSLFEARIPCLASDQLHPTQGRLLFSGWYDATPAYQSTFLV